VRDALLLDRVGKGIRDVFLPHHVRETLRPVLASDDLV
jgi:hypothetical protein